MHNRTIATERKRTGGFNSANEKNSGGHGGKDANAAEGEGRGNEIEMA